MPRKPSIRYFPSRKAFYCQWQGKQYRLADGPDDRMEGPTFLAALEAFKQVMTRGRLDQLGDGNTVRNVCESYMQYAKTRIKASTLTGRVYRLRPFMAACGEVPVAELTHAHVEVFLDGQQGWGKATVATFFQVLDTAFNWASKRDLISKNPIAGMDRPRIPSRSRDCLVSPALHEKILAECRAQSMRNFCIALEDTGARPGELVAATASDWNDALGALVYHSDDRRREDEFRHKSAKYKNRVIHFTGQALEIVRQAVQKRKVIFPSRKGTAYHGKAIQSCFRALGDRLGLPGLTAYSYRHTFATNWLLAGKSIDILAELLGNTPATIRKYYSHLCGDPQGVRRQLEDFRKQEERIHN